jgi:hypothetical protein
MVANSDGGVTLLDERFSPEHVLMAASVCLWPAIFNGAARRKFTARGWPEGG